MSFQAVAWAFQQDLPPVPKFVLVALCERANAETGECWPGIDAIAKAVSLSPRSTVTYIAALVRNGFVMKQAMRGADGRKRTNHYWVLFDRKPAEWINPGVEDNSPNDEVSEDTSDHVQTVAHGESEGNSEGNPQDHVQTASPGPCATACTLHNKAEPSGFEPSQTEQVAGQAGQAPAVVGYRPEARLEQVDRLKAAEEARRPKHIPVFEGSDPWSYWVRDGGHPPTLTTLIEHDGKRRRGWYFRTLYPPKATGPPKLAGTLMTEHDRDDLAKELR